MSAAVSSPTSATIGLISTVGYAGVSTDHQSLEAQLDALRATGCERIFTDKLSGVRDDRPGLAGLLDYVRPGDTVVVAALDRLGRSLSAVIRTIERLTETGVLPRSLREGIDYSTPTGRMLAGIFAALAGYETRTDARAGDSGPRSRSATRTPHRPAATPEPRSSVPGSSLASRRRVDHRTRVNLTVSRATIYRAFQDPTANDSAAAPTSV